MNFLGVTFGFDPASNPPDMAAHYIIFNALWAYTASSTRVLKNFYKIDNHVSPRGDLDKYGPRAVLDGKMTQAQLDMLRRNEAAHHNSMEHFPVFAAALILAKMAGLPAADINMAGFAYSVLRLAFFGNYVFSTTMNWAALRPIFWWASNIVCLRLIWRAGKAANAVA